MIFKDKKLGLVLADKETAYWTNIVKHLEAEKESLLNAIKTNDAFLDKAKEMLKKAK